MSKKNIWLILENEYKKKSSDFGGKILSDIQIISAEQELSIHFSKGYKKFLEEYGSWLSPGFIIYGLVPLSYMGDDINTVITLTQFYRDYQKWPDIDDWYIVSDDGFGNPIGIDPNGKVWLSDHDSDFVKIRLADDFEEFLYRIYTETLFEE